jgi:hypothetical protein
VPPEPTPSPAGPPPPYPPLTPGAPLVSTIAALESALSDAAAPEILIAPGTYKLTGASTQLEITRALVMKALIPGTVVIDADGSSESERRPLHVDAGSGEDVLISGIEFTGGYCHSSCTGSGFEDFGGGILHETGNLNLTDVRIAENTAASGGGFYKKDDSALLHLGPGTMIYDNRATGKAAGLMVDASSSDSTVTGEHCTISANQVYSGPRRTPPVRHASPVCLPRPSTMPRPPATPRAQNVYSPRHTLASISPSRLFAVPEYLGRPMRWRECLRRRWSHARAQTQRGQ